MTTDDKPYFEIEFAVYFQNGGIRLTPVEQLEPGPAMAAIQDGLFAEVWIPYHTETETWCFTCHIFGKANNEPAVMEMMALKQVAPQIYQNFHPLGRKGASG